MIAIAKVWEIAAPIDDKRRIEKSLAGGKSELMWLALLEVPIVKVWEKGVIGAV